ncbi:MAG: DUF1569 domain-containing protein [Chitinophagaceae bacterium]
MQTLFDLQTRNAILDRIKMLKEENQPLWGKMTVSQMLKHCNKFDKLMQGKEKYKQSLLGKLFGKMALKGMLKDDSPAKKNMPTVPGFKITENGNFDQEKQNWLGSISQYAEFTDSSIIHPFFGNMTHEQIGQLAYKHTDHHLRQFNC